MKKIIQYWKYKKYCSNGQHYVSHLLKRYIIIARFDKSKQAILGTKQVRMCKQCAENYGEWSRHLKTARIEVITKTLLR